MQLARFEDVDLGAVYGDLVGNRGDAARPYAVVNMVSTLDGKAALATKAGHLGSSTDRLLMRQVRAACDAVLYGVGTLRAENVDPTIPASMAEERRQRGQGDQLLRVVVSESGNLPLDNLFFRVAGPAPVIFTGDTAARAKIELLRPAFRTFTAGIPVDLRRVAKVLAGQLGVRSIVVEGGPALTYSMLRAGLIDEVLMTLAPKVVGGRPALTIADGPELPPELRPALDLVSVYREQSELFLRYRILNAAEPREERRV